LVVSGAGGATVEAGGLALVTGAVASIGAGAGVALMSVGAGVVVSGVVWAMAADAMSDAAIRKVAFIE